MSSTCACKNGSRCQSLSQPRAACALHRSRACTRSDTRKICVHARDRADLVQVFFLRLLHADLALGDEKDLLPRLPWRAQARARRSRRSTSKLVVMRGNSTEPAHARGPEDVFGYSFHRVSPYREQEVRRTGERLRRRAFPLACFSCCGARDFAAGSRPPPRSRGVMVTRSIVRSDGMSYITFVSRPSITARRPRAPILRSMALSAIASSALVLERRAPRRRSSSSL